MLSKSPPEAQEIPESAERENTAQKRTEKGGMGGRGGGNSGQLADTHCTYTMGCSEKSLFNFLFVVVLSLEKIFCNTFYEGLLYNAL